MSASREFGIQVSAEVAKLTENSDQKWEVYSETLKKKGFSVYISTIFIFKI